jgi:hypothetical protein
VYDGEEHHKRERVIGEATLHLISAYELLCGPDILSPWSCDEERLLEVATRALALGLVALDERGSDPPAVACPETSQELSAPWSRDGGCPPWSLRSSRPGRRCPGGSSSANAGPDSGLT